MSKCRVYTLHMAFESGIGEEKRLLGLCTIVILCDILVFSNLYLWITTQHAKDTIYIFINHAQNERLLFLQTEIVVRTTSVGAARCDSG